MTPAREEALSLIKKHLRTEPMITHSLCVEALMEGLATELEGDPALWGIAGLVHDVDYETTAGDPALHGKPGAELLESLGYPAEVVAATLSHNSHARRESPLDHALAVADALSGLVYASALMRPDRKISTMTVQSLKKKFKARGFAAGANREAISAGVDTLGTPLDRLFEIAILSMGSKELELGLG